MISIIIPTRNRKETLRECIENLCAIDIYSESDEIIILDNSDVIDKDNVQRIKEICRDNIDINYIELSGKFVGNPGAMRNMGIGMSDQDIIVFIDDDSFIETKDWTREIAEVFKDEGVWALTGNIKEPGKDLKKWDGKSPIGKFEPEGGITGKYYYCPDGAIEVDHIRGCFLVIKRLALDEVGDFDKLYNGMYFEETDLCMRVKKNR